MIEDEQQKVVQKNFKKNSKFSSPSSQQHKTFKATHHTTTHHSLTGGSFDARVKFKKKKKEWQTHQQLKAPLCGVSTWTRENKINSRERRPRTRLNTSDCF
jgi:hypothetical protein